MTTDQFGGIVPHVAPAIGRGLVSYGLDCLRLAQPTASAPISDDVLMDGKRVVFNVRLTVVENSPPIAGAHRDCFVSQCFSAGS